MEKDIIVESVFCNRIVYIVIFVCIPVFSKFLWTQYQNRFISVLIVFYNCKSCKCFAKTNAVCQNTTVICFQFIDDCKNSIFLKIVKQIPDFALFKSGCFIRQIIFGNIFEKFAEDMIECYKIDKFW